MLSVIEVIFHHTKQGNESLYASNLMHVLLLENLPILSTDDAALVSISISMWYIKTIHRYNLLHSTLC